MVEMVTGEDGHEAVAASDEPKKPQKSEKSEKSLRSQSEKSEKDGVQLALTCNAYATKGA